MADNPRSVSRHIQAKQDDLHAGEKGDDHWEEIERTAVDSDEGASSSPSSPESGEGGETEPAHFPTAEGAKGSADESAASTPDCCPDPTLSGEAGDHFRLEDGSVIELEAGDQICLNCDTIHERD
jgi:hypothetical protein